jgi:drug/metabolite transporter (DMT)-like permease
LKADAIPAYASAFAGSFFWGLFSALSKKKNYPALTSMAVYKASAFLGFSLAFLLSGSLVLPSLGHLPAIVLLGFVVNGLAYLLWIMALSAGDTAWVSSGVYATPVVALLYLALAGRSSLKLYHLIGLFFVLSGPLFILRQKRERRRT